MFIDTGNIKNTIFIAGSGRSGTTWLMEMINYKNQFRPIFEPFHNKYNSLLKNWKYRQYLSENNVDDKFMSSIISFIYLYIIIFFFITALLSLSGLDFVTSISAAATSISNVGPGLGTIIGPNGNFSQLPDFSKWVLSFGMILGRLELFAILVLFLPSFWQK